MWFLLIWTLNPLHVVRCDGIFCSKLIFSRVMFFSRPCGKDFCLQSSVRHYALIPQTLVRIAWLDNLYMKFHFSEHGTCLPCSSWWITVFHHCFGKELKISSHCPLNTSLEFSGIKTIVVMSRTIGWHRQITTNKYLLMYCSYMNVSYLKRLSRIWKSHIC